MQAMSGEILQGKVNPMFPGLQHVRLQALRATRFPVALEKFLAVSQSGAFFL